MHEPLAGVGLCALLLQSSSTYRYRGLIRLCRPGAQPQAVMHYIACIRACKAHALLIFLEPSGHRTWKCDEPFTPTARTIMPNVFAKFSTGLMHMCTGMRKAASKPEQVVHALCLNNWKALSLC